MRNRIVITLGLLAVAAFLFSTSIREAEADPIGEALAIRAMDFTGDDIVTSVRANIEFSAPHVEAGTSSINLSIIGPQTNDPFSEDVILGVGYVKEPGSQNLGWQSVCFNCGLAAERVVAFHGLVDDYSTPVRIVIKKNPPAGLGQPSTFDVLWFIDDGAGADREEKNITLHGGGKRIEVGGIVTGDDENDMGIAGIVGIRFNGVFPPCGGFGQPTCITGAWVPEDGDEEVVLHGGFDRYFTTFWKESGFPIGGNLQVWTECHKTGTCEFP